MKLLCIGLRLNKSVTALDLPDNDIGDAGVVELSLSVAHNSSLTQLQLAYNRISDEGAKALAEVGGRGARERRDWYSRSEPWPSLVHMRISSLSARLA